MLPLVITLILITLLTIYFIGVYNSLVGLNNKIVEQWNQIEDNLKRRNIIIPSLVEVIKKYAKKEKDIYNEINDSIYKYNEANTKREIIDSASLITKSISKLSVLIESNPKIKTNEDFIKQQEYLKEAEDKISYNRQFYNDSVMMYNNLVEMFPSSIIAKIFKFKKEIFYETLDEEDKITNNDF